MALGLLSRRESRKDLWARLMTLLLLYIMLICTLRMLQDTMKMLKMLVFDRTRLSLLFWHFCSPVHLYSLSFENDAYVV